MKAVIDVIESDGFRVGGRRVVNYQFAGKSVTTAMLRESTGVDAKLLDNLDKRYPGLSIAFDKAGNPNFSEYAKETIDFKFVNRDSDIKNEWNSIKGKYSKDELARLQENYTWHHRGDETLELIPTDIHDAYRHTGGDAYRRAGMFDRAKAAAASAAVTLAASAVSNTSAAIKDQGIVEALSTGSLENAAFVDVANAVDPGVQLLANGAIDGVNGNIGIVNDVLDLLDKPTLNSLPNLDLGEFYKTVVQDKKESK